MAAKKSSKVKDLPRKSVSSKKASNIKGGATTLPKPAKRVGSRMLLVFTGGSTDRSRNQEYFQMTDKKNAPVRDLPEKKIPAGKADQIKGGRKITE